MRSYNFGNVGSKRGFNVGFGVGLGWTLARELVPFLAFVLFLGLLTSPRLTLALLALPAVVWLVWRTRGLWHESKEQREWRAARERWGGR